MSEYEDDVQVPQVVVTRDTFEDQLREYFKTAGIIDEASANLNQMKAEQDALSYALAQYMMKASIKKLVLDGVTFTQKQRVFSKVEDKEALREWIEKNNAVDLLMAVNSSKLTAYCNEQLEQGGDTPAGVNPNFIKYSVHAK